MPRPPPSPDDPWEAFEEGETTTDRRPAALEDGVPEPIGPEETTPAPDLNPAVTPAELAELTDLADRDGYARGLLHGRQAGREEALEVVRSLWVIFELGPGGKTAPDWETALAWARRRLA